MAFLKIWVSDDATRITGRLQYASTWNSIVGFVLPLNEFGIPETGIFPATSPSAIKKHFDTETIAANASCIMAQPLTKDAPAFCLSCFSTDNKFTTNNVMDWWLWMEELAK